MDKEILQIVKNQFNQHVVEESLERIIKCLNYLSLEEIWYKHNDHTNSIGNLVLHLQGNIRQYIVSGVGGKADTRQRELEFSSTDEKSHAILISHIKETIEEANQVVQDLSSCDLIKQVVIQGFDHSVLSAIIHVVEHLSYHVGQITYCTKYFKDLDTAYYGDLDLDVVNE